MKMYIFVLFILYFSNTLSLPLQPQSVDKPKEHDPEGPPESKEPVPILQLETGGKKEVSSVKKELDTTQELHESRDSKQNITSNETAKGTNFTNTAYKSPEVESGAVMRGVFVFVGIGLLFIIYIGCKTYNRKKKPTVIIKKYGVRTKRSDIEMEPLPLDEDEEDEILFDVGHINRT